MLKWLENTRGAEPKSIWMESVSPSLKEGREMIIEMIFVLLLFDFFFIII